MKKLIYVLAFAVITASCNMPDNSGNMNSKAEANKARMQQFYDEVINAHNTAMLDSFCTPDFIDHNPDPGHTGKGIEDISAMFKSFMESFPDIHASTNFMIAQGDTVMAHITMSGTNTGPMGGAPATNKQFSMDGIDVVVLKDGKAVERWGFFDNMKMMQQLGMMPAPGTEGAPADSTMAKPEEKK
ncbi:MAG TPA: ester cyclase [Bacteroidia bacterium]|nr:ester cyclase [Bacteroidia bacterium]